MAPYLEALATLCINYRGKPKDGGIKTLSEKRAIINVKVILNEC